MNMTRTDIPIAPGVGRQIDGLFELVGRGVRELARPFVARENAAAFRGVSGAIALARRLGRLLRFALIVLAANLLHAGLLPPRRPPHPHTKPRRGLTFRTPRAFRLWAMLRISYIDEQRASPFARTTPDPVLTLTRRIAALSRVVADPMPLVRRLARRLEVTTRILGWWPPKRPPPMRRRIYWDELLWVYDQASFEMWRLREARCPDTS